MEYFYGFLGGETNSIIRRSTRHDRAGTEQDSARLSLHRGHDDKAINWVRQQKALMPDKPFFVYYVPGATHAPHHVPRNGPTNTRANSMAAGQLREETFARQKAWA